MKVFYISFSFFSKTNLYTSSIRIYCNYIESYLRDTIFMYVLSNIILLSVKNHCGYPHWSYNTNIAWL